MGEKKSIKKRSWAFVLYPESAPEDWFEKLKQSGLQGAVSPLHDKDVNADGEPKKAHHHVILVYPGPTTFNNVKTFCTALNCPIPIPLESVKGYYRYFSHQDNPEKYQYDEKDILTFNGFDYSDFVEMTKSEVLALIKQIQAFIRDNDILEYSDLLDLLIDCDMLSEFDIATSHTLLFNCYISSRRNKRLKSARSVCEDE